MSRPDALREIARLFATLGLIGFGGPAAHIALMRQEVVVRRRWLSDEQLIDLVPWPSWSSEERWGLWRRRSVLNARLTLH